MDLSQIQQWLWWMLIINLGIYLSSVIAVVLLKGFVYRIQKKLFGLQKEATGNVLVGYLGSYKLLIIVFNLVPWLALELMV